MTDREYLKDLRGMIAARKATVGVFGAGYVGLPLACAFAGAGFTTIACDTENRKVDAIRQGISYVEDQYVVGSLPRLVNSGILSAESDPIRVASVADFHIITLPTPLNETGEPDLSYVTGLAETIAGEIRPGVFVILESSVYPGTTEEILKPILERSGLKAGQHFGLAHSPERISPGSKRFDIRTTAKVVGGVTPECTQIAAELYASVLSAPIVPVSDARTAESVKMLENTYRYVNIALVDELAILHEQLGIDLFEVIAAASTKPFGFQAFYPGPGVGGHCIPKDPHYLSFRAHQVGQRLKLVEASQEVIKGMTHHIIRRLSDRLSGRAKVIRGSNVVLLGLAFKEEVSDTRNSPSIALAERLEELGATVRAYDPFVESISTRRGTLRSTKSLELAVKDADILVLVTAHALYRAIDLKELASKTRAGATIVDLRGFWSPQECKSAGFDYLGLGRPDCD